MTRNPPIPVNSRRGCRLYFMFCGENSGGSASDVVELVFADLAAQRVAVYPQILAARHWLPLERSRTRLMNFFSNSVNASSRRMPRSTIMLMSDSN